MQNESKIIRYKSVRLFPEGYQSSYDVYPIRYSVGEWIESPIPGTGLLVWNSMEYALYGTPEFDKDIPFHIFESECEERIELPHRCFNFPVPRKYIEHLWSVIFWDWEGNYAHRLMSEMYPWPNGTEAYRRIKLIRRLA